MARSFGGDASGDRIIVGTTNIPTTTDLTVIALVKQDATDAHAAILVRSSGTGNGWRAGLGTSDRMRFTKQGVADINSTLALTNGTWYALAYKVDVDTDVKFFRKALGGTLSTETVANTSAITAPSGGDTQIGARLGDNITIWNGAIAIVAVYSGLLSDALIEHVMNCFLGGQWGQGLRPEVRGLWSLLGTSPEADYSGNGNNSTSITGTSVVSAPIGAMISPDMLWQGIVAAAAPAAGQPIFLRHFAIPGTADWRAGRGGHLG